MSYFLLIYDDGNLKQLVAIARRRGDLDGTLGRIDAEDREYMTIHECPTDVDGVHLVEPFEW